MTRKPKTSECVYTTSDKAKEEKYGGSLFFSIAPFPTPPFFFLGAASQLIERG